MSPLKSTVLLLLSILIVYFPSQHLIASELPTRSYSYSQDFETEDPFQFWTSNGTYSVNFKGLSHARASSGRSSFKLDVTLLTATYVYWMIPVKIPAVGRLQFTGDLYVESSAGVDATLGTDVSLAPAPASGVAILKKITAPTRAWVTQTSDLVSQGNELATLLTGQYFAAATPEDVGVWTDRVGLFLFAPKGGRITLYVDNIHLQGVVPDEASYQALADREWQNYLNRIQVDTNQVVHDILGCTCEVPGAGDKAFIQNSKLQAASLRDTVGQRGYPTPKEYARLKEMADGLKFLTLQAPFYSADYQNQALITYPWEPITPASKKILPLTYPVPAVPGKALAVKACRGQFEPVSFILRARRPVPGIRISASDLIGPQWRRIPASAIDVKLVKCWYQAGGGTILKSDARVLVPGTAAQRRQAGSRGLRAPEKLSQGNQGRQKGVYRHQLAW